MFIAPCNGCPLSEGCAQREVFAGAARHTGAVSISFSCKKLTAELRPGRRVVITAPMWGEDTSGYEPLDLVSGKYEVKATIIGVHSYKFVSVVDPGQLQEDYCKGGVIKDQYRFRRKQPHSRIVRFLEEPDLRLCEHGNVVRDGYHDAMQHPCQCDEMKALKKAWEKALA